METWARTRAPAALQPTAREAVRLVAGESWDGPMWRWRRHVALRGDLELREARLPTYHGRIDYTVVRIKMQAFNSGIHRINEIYTMYMTMRSQNKTFTGIFLVLDK